jgi:PKD repeat protein
MYNITLSEKQKYFGSYPTGGGFVYFNNPPRELEWEYNRECFNGTINEFNLLVSDNKNHSWNLSRFELHINGVNCSYPDTQSFYRKYWAFYQWEITWNNLSKYCDGVILFEILYLDCIWIHSKGDLDGDGDGSFHYSYKNPRRYINGTLDGEHKFDSDKAYIVWYTPCGEPQSPIANFTFKPSNPSTADIIFFKSKSYDCDGYIVNWTWDFDDGNYSYGKETTHQYSEEGNYSVNLTVTDDDNFTAFVVKSIVVVENQPPYKPGHEVPVNNSHGISTNINLSWDGGDPDGDPVTYDVYFGTKSPPPQVSENQSDTMYSPGTLISFTNYYWKIVAWDNHGASTVGPLWCFKTIGPGPHLFCFGTINWTRVKPGSTVSGNFSVYNLGGGGTKLDWNITNWPSWGEWSFDPDGGHNLEPGNPVTVEVVVIAPDEKNEEFSGEIKIENKNNTNESCTIDIKLVTPKNKSFNFNFILLKRLLYRFPILQKILNVLRFSIR